jgi:hypothetical protein
MQLKKYMKESLKSSGYESFEIDLKELSSFYQENYIKKLTIKLPLPDSLIGQNCLLLLQTNLFRSKKLAEGFVDGLNRQNPLLSTLMARAYFETTGAIALLFKKYTQYKEGNLSYDELDAILQSLYLGIKEKGIIPEAPDPFNVMKLIDAVDHYLQKQTKENKQKRFRSGYDDLSEICHPNSLGYLLGHKISKDLRTISFTGETEPLPLNEYHIKHFAFASGVYQLIFKALKESVIQNEPLPFYEFS